MNRTTWIIVAVVAFILFRDRIAGWFSGGVTVSSYPGGYPGPPPSAAPPGGNPTHWTDVINNAITSGAGLLNTWLSGPPAAPPSSGGSGMAAAYGGY